MSDDIIEQMARAAHATCYMPGKSWEESSIGIREVYIMEMRAAYAIARRAVLEEAAKVAEAFPARNHGNLATAPYAAAEQAADEIAAAIRKLAGEA